MRGERLLWLPSDVKRSNEEDSNKGAVPGLAFESQDLATLQTCVHGQAFTRRRHQGDKPLRIVAPAQTVTCTQDYNSGTHMHVYQHEK